MADDKNTWNFKYKDVLVVTKELDVVGDDGMVDSITAKHKPPWPVVIIEHKNGVDCDIFSNKEIPGLEIAETDAVIEGVKK